MPNSSTSDLRESMRAMAMPVGMVIKFDGH